MFEQGEVAYDGIGVVLREAEGRVFIDGIHHGGPADEAGLLRGDELVAIDGAPPSAVDAFAGRAGERVTLALRRHADAPLREIVVEPERIRPNEAFLQALETSMELIEHEGGAIGYVRVWSYARDAYHQALRAALWNGPLAEAEALVLDLRGGWGGAQPHYAELFVGGAPTMTMTNRRGEERVSSFVWPRPVVVLIDGGTRSGKEVIASALQKNGVPLVGQRSAGALLAGQAFLLSDDSLVILAVLDVALDGQRIEGVGIAPDIEVDFDLPYAAGADPQRDAAIKEAVRLMEAAGG